MPKFLFDSGRDGFLVGSVNWVTGTVVPYIISSYNFNASQNVFLSDIPQTGNMWKARGTYLASRGHIAGIATAASYALIAAVGSGGAATAHAVILVNETGASQTSLLITYDDTLTGVPFVPNGADVQVDWNAAGIFQL